MNTTVKSPSIGIRIQHVLRLVFAFVLTFLCKLYYGEETKKIPPIKDEILKEPAFEVAKKIRNKETSSVEVLEACIRRIKDVNSALNCFVEERFELAMKEAKEADDLVKSGKMTTEALEQQKPLLGVPFTTKDCIGVKGLHQTSGVVLRKDFICPEDAPVIKLLRDKGAIIIGLTNVPELCMWWETHNHIFGRTNNPYNTNRIVGGSSGGEGCLQAAAGSIFGVGSDIGGSIRMPAYFNGIFGHKPSQKIVSNEGEYPPASTEVHDRMLGTGPLTRHASDLKPLLKIMAGENVNKLNLDQEVDIGKVKIKYQYSLNALVTDPVDPEIIMAMNKVIEYFKVEHRINATEIKIKELEKSLPLWFATMTSPKSFGEFIMEDSSKTQIVKEFFKHAIGLSGNTLIGLFMAMADYNRLEIGGEKYNVYAKRRQELEDLFKDMLGDDGVFLLPTHPTAALYHNEPLARPLNFGYTAIINCLGLPATNVPLGLNRDGLPIGIQVIANHDNDRLCLAVAEELDKAFGGWVEPQKTS